MGEVDRAIGMLERSRMDIGDELKGWSELGYAYAVAGRRDDALECLRKLELRRDRDKDAELTMDIAVVQQGLGDKDAVFRHLNEAVDKRVGGVVFMQTHPGWDELRSDPRFADLLERIGFRRRGS
jgi:tetratricopeptide (TPR) repeat protein